LAKYLTLLELTFLSEMTWATHAL